MDEMDSEHSPDESFEGDPRRSLKKASPTRKESTSSMELNLLDQPSGRNDDFPEEVFPQSDSLAVEPSTRRVSWSPEPDAVHPYSPVDESGLEAIQEGERKMPSRARSGMVRQKSIHSSEEMESSEVPQEPEGIYLRKRSGLVRQRHQDLTEDSADKSEVLEENPEIIEENVKRKKSKRGSLVRQKPIETPEEYAEHSIPEDLTSKEKEHSKKRRLIRQKPIESKEPADKSLCNVPEDPIPEEKDAIRKVHVKKRLKRQKSMEISERADISKNGSTEDLIKDVSSKKHSKKHPLERQKTTETYQGSEHSIPEDSATEKINTGKHSKKFRLKKQKSVDTSPEYEDQSIPERSEEVKSKTKKKKRSLIKQSKVLEEPADESMDIVPDESITEDVISTKHSKKHHLKRQKAMRSIPDDTLSSELLANKSGTEDMITSKRHILKQHNARKITEDTLMSEEPADKSVAEDVPSTKPSRKHRLKRQKAVPNNPEDILPSKEAQITEDTLMSEEPADKSVAEDVPSTKPSRKHHLKRKKAVPNNPEDILPSEEAKSKKHSKLVRQQSIPEEILQSKEEKSKRHSLVHQKASELPQELLDKPVAADVPISKQHRLKRRKATRSSPEDILPSEEAKSKRHSKLVRQNATAFEESADQYKQEEVKGKDPTEISEDKSEHTTLEDDLGISEVKRKKHSKKRGLVRQKAVDIAEESADISENTEQENLNQYFEVIEPLPEHEPLSQLVERLLSAVSEPETTKPEITVFEESKERECEDKGEGSKDGNSAEEHKDSFEGKDGSDGNSSQESKDSSDCDDSGDSSEESEDDSEESEDDSEEGKGDSEEGEDDSEEGEDDSEEGEDDSVDSEDGSENSEDGSDYSSDDDDDSSSQDETSEEDKRKRIVRQQAVQMSEDKSKRLIRQKAVDIGDEIPEELESSAEDDGSSEEESEESKSEETESEETESEETESEEMESEKNLEGLPKKVPASELTCYRPAFTLPSAKYRPSGADKPAEVNPVKSKRTAHPSRGGKVRPSKKGATAPPRPKVRLTHRRFGQPEDVPVTEEQTTTTTSIASAPPFSASTLEAMTGITMDDIDLIMHKAKMEKLKADREQGLAEATQVGEVYTRWSSVRPLGTLPARKKSRKNLSAQFLSPDTEPSSSTQPGSDLKRLHPSKSSTMSASSLTETLHLSKGASEISQSEVLTKLLQSSVTKSASSSKSKCSTSKSPYKPRLIKSTTYKRPKVPVATTSPSLSVKGLHMKVVKPPTICIQGIGVPKNKDKSNSEEEKSPADESIAATQATTSTVPEKKPSSQIKSSSAAKSGDKQAAKKDTTARPLRLSLPAKRIPPAGELDLESPRKKPSLSPNVTPRGKTARSPRGKDSQKSPHGKGKKSTKTSKKRSLSKTK